jgi:hypothetical protein
MKTIITLLLTLASSASFAEFIVCTQSGTHRNPHNSVSFEIDALDNITEVRSSEGYGGLLHDTCRSSNTSDGAKLTTCSVEKIRNEDGLIETHTAEIKQIGYKFSVKRSIKQPGTNIREVDFNNCRVASNN